MPTLLPEENRYHGHLPPYSVTFLFASTSAPCAAGRQKQDAGHMTARPASVDTGAATMCLLALEPERQRPVCVGYELPMK